MIKRNIVANMIGRAWGIVSVYLFIPLYLKFLGAEAYGLVGFYVTLMGVIAFADMGLTATLNREMARLSVQKDSAGDQADLLRTYEMTYMCISLAISILVWFLAPFIANHWLQSKALDPREIASVIRIMGISIAFLLPTNLYIGGLMGLQKQVLTNSLQIGWGLLRGVGAVLILWLISLTVIAFFWWQLLTSIAYCLAARAALWWAVSRDAVRPCFKWLVFQSTWRYALGMAGMAFLSTVLVQTDKLAISKLLPLETFGYYMLAVAMASIPRMLAGPIGVAVFPRITCLVAAGDANGLVRFYHRVTSLFAVAIIPIGLTLAVFSGDFLFAWTGNLTVAQQMGFTAALLIVGEAMQAIAVPPYYLALAHGNVRLNLQVNVAAVVVITPLMIILITKYGVVGAGISWVVMNLCTLPPYMYFVHRRFMPGELRHWCLLGVGRPLLVALPCVLLGRWLVPHIGSRLLSLCLIGLVGGAATIMTAATIAEFRSAFVKKMRSIWGMSFGA